MSVSFLDWRHWFLSLLFCGVVVGSAVGQVPRTIAFQGLLTNDQGVPIATGDYGITFRLYNVAANGSALWTEVQSVSVVDGVANATLGRINPLTLAFDVPYWLGITLQQGGTELEPRIALTSGPYALMAQSVPNGSITAEKIADGAVTTDKIQDEGLGGSAIADGAITPGKLADGVITAVKMADDAVGSGAIIDGSIVADDIADGAIGSDAIANGAVGSDAIANGAVGSDAIADGAVGPTKINVSGASNGEALVYNGTSLVWGAPSGAGVISEVVAGDGLTGGGTEGIVTLDIGADALTADFIAEDAIGNSELGDDAVDTANLVDGAVTTTKIDPGTAVSGDFLSFDGADVVWAMPTIGNGSVDSTKLASSAVTTVKIDDDAVTTSKIAPGAVTTDEIGAGAVTTEKIASGAVTEDEIGLTAVTEDRIASDAVTTSKIADGDVTLPKIDATGAVASDVIRYTGSAVEWGAVDVPDGSIDTDKLQDLSVTSGKIADAAVTTAKIANNAVGSTQIGLGQITNSHIGGLLNLDKLSTVGADEGEVITFTGGVVTWASGVVPPAGNVTIDGDLTVTGSVAKGGGTFKIDHPLDPENRYLYHSFVESDEMMNVYSGNVILESDGGAWIELPAWFEALNKDFRYQLTCVGGYAPVYVDEPVASGRFRIAGGRPGLQVSWQVTAVRNDPWAQQHRMRVEVDKPEGEKGSLLHPDAYGQ